MNKRMNGLMWLSVERLSRGLRRILLAYLASDKTTVAGRKVAIKARDAFEASVRRGVLDPLFYEAK